MFADNEFNEDGASHPHPLHLLLLSKDPLNKMTSERDFSFTFQNRFDVQIAITSPPHGLTRMHN
jgi:hypothetical protein